MTDQGRDYDVVLWGATGYTGQLVAEHLRVHGGGARLALGGRNAEKLDQVRARLNAEDLPLLVGDSTDEAFLSRLAQQTAVVCTTVGPYAKFGSGLVGACAEAGTSYCDLSGELHWIRQMIDTHEATARKTGARLVHSCGFDSVPSDIGVFALQAEAQQQLGGPCSHVRARLTDFQGYTSGGTMASMRALFEAARRDPAVRRTLLDPYGLNPQGQRTGPDGRDPLGPAFDPDFGWTAPFVMASANTRIVRRSNAVMGYPYGRDFRYEEALATGRGLRGFSLAGAITAGTAGAMLAMAVPGLSNLLAHAAPHPGEGPTAAQRAAGHFTYQLLGTRGGGAVRSRVTCHVDPGYGATARMLAESALGLALDGDQLPVGGGSWTPASALGLALVERLNRAGVTVSAELERG